MASDDTDEPFKQEFHDAVSDYWHSRDAVANTADFGEPGGKAEQQHRNHQDVLKASAAALRQLFDEAAEHGFKDVELAKFATVSPLELSTIRAELGI